MGMFGGIPAHPTEYSPVGILTLLYTHAVRDLPVFFSVSFCVPSVYLPTCLALHVSIHLRTHPIRGSI